MIEAFTSFSVELEAKVSDLERRLAALEKLHGWLTDPAVGTGTHAHPQASTVTDWQWLAEDRSKSIDAMGKVAGALEADLAAVRDANTRNAGDLNTALEDNARLRDERDASRDLLTDAEHTRDMALSRVEEVEHERDGARKLYEKVMEDNATKRQEIDSLKDQLNKANWGWHGANCERDALLGITPSKGKMWVDGRLVDVPMLLAAHEDLQARLDALATWEPSRVEMEEIRGVFYGAPNKNHEALRRVSLYVRDALLADTVQDGGMFTFNEPTTDTECSGIPRPSPGESAKATCERCNPPAATEASAEAGPTVFRSCNCLPIPGNAFHMHAPGCPMAEFRSTPAPASRWCQRCSGGRVITWPGGTTTPCDVCSAPAPIIPVASRRQLNDLRDAITLEMNRLGVVPCADDSTDDLLDSLERLRAAAKEQKP